MEISLNCQTDEFAKFKSGLHKAIFVEGTQKPWENGYDFKLGDIVAVSNCDSKDVLTFQISELTKYTGAYTLEKALSDFRFRHKLSGADNMSSVYLAVNAPTSLMPALYEGIYAILIRPYIRNHNPY